MKGAYEVAVGDRAVYVRVHGLASMTNCLCVRDFLDGMLRAHRTFVVLDLADCTGMDSTFMGVLAGVAGHDASGASAGVAIVNASERLTKLLDGVGLTELIYVDATPFEPPSLEFHVLEEQASERDRLELVRSAHEHLIAISQQNEVIFGPLVRAMEQEMRARGMLPA